MQKVYGLLLLTQKRKTGRIFVVVSTTLTGGRNAAQYFKTNVDFFSVKKVTQTVVLEPKPLLVSRGFLRIMPFGIRNYNPDIFPFFI